MRLLTTILINKEKQAICTTILLESSFSREGKGPDASFLKMSVAHVTNINLKGKSTR
jgi:hypothetical protein